MEWISIVSLISIPVIIGIGWLRGWSILLAITVAMAALFVVSLVTGVDRLTLSGSPLLADLAWRPVYLDVAAWPHWYTLVSSMFLHADPLHLLMNLVIFIIMGVGLEERIGRGRFLAVFGVSGILGTLLFSLTQINSAVPLVGASGAVFGVMGAYATLYPRDRVFFFFILIIPNVPVYIAATIYTVVEVVRIVLSPSPNVAHYAHVGGLLAGALFAFILARYAHLPELEHRHHRRRKKGAPGETTEESPTGKTSGPSIASLVETEEQERLYKQLQENRDEPELAAAWLERFAATARCPRCGAHLTARGGVLKCSCGYLASE